MEFSACPGFTKLSEASFGQGISEFSFMCLTNGVGNTFGPCLGNGMGITVFVSVLYFAESPCLTLGKSPNLSRLDLSHLNSDI